MSRDKDLWISLWITIITFLHLRARIILRHTPARMSSLGLARRVQRVRAPLFAAVAGHGARRLRKSVMQVLHATSVRVLMASLDNEIGDTDMKLYGVNTPVTAYAVVDSLSGGIVVAMRPTHRRALNACRKIGPVHGRYWVTPAYLLTAAQMFGVCS
jgi:hypothetical protein